MTDKLVGAIRSALDALERDGEIVIASASNQQVASLISEAVLRALPDANLTPEEAGAVCSLILHAVGDERFFDWEMPTLTGASATEFRQIAEKLSPKPYRP